MKLLVVALVAAGLASVALMPGSAAPKHEIAGTPYPVYCLTSHVAGHPIPEVCVPKPV